MKWNQQQEFKSWTRLLAFLSPVLLTIENNIVIRSFKLNGLFLTATGEWTLFKQLFVPEGLAWKHYIRPFQLSSVMGIIIEKGIYDQSSSPGQSCLWINFYLLQTFCPHLGRFFLCCFFFHYVSAKFHLWPSSGDLPWPQIRMLSLVTISPVITAFNSCCLSHHIDRNIVKEETTQKKNYQDKDKKSAINKN